jgi:hypothetical protein
VRATLDGIVRGVVEGMGKERVAHRDGGLPLCYKVLIGETSGKRGRDCRGARTW